MPANPTTINLSTTTPAAPAGNKNVHWQADSASPRNVSAYQVPADDSALPLVDNTNNDVSTARHGFAPKGTGTGTKYLDDTGGWSAPSGGSLQYPDTPPSSPDALDDEFNVGTLDAKWTGPDGVYTPIGSLSSYVSYDVATTIPGWLQARLQGVDGYFNIYQASGLPSGDFDVTVKFSVIGDSQYVGAGIFCSNGTDQNATDANRICVEHVNAAVGPPQINAGLRAHFDYKTSSAWYYNQGTVFITHKHGAQFLHLARTHSGATIYWSAWYSSDGITWANLVLNYPHSFTVAAIYLALYLAGANGDWHIACDWIRFNWLTLP